ncbi:hypothetical protein TTHERM_00049220 (macronuclear) [Tetrahymena thermophila SB210]|uniref:RING-type domain-containing protein n=1 Tax=Tetrahymena thermophila (strain SB210) TaxID=312017 RepID=Q23D69_TETTS|nr:hypothetical protein TTHERM_00049220 [Tetrahymena thermophila SB210]EAR94443.4 hypothetical protein TTHERM_00049220 [Tetrahymena thermophila SB210]|eukprot:XP_001014817.4 hypothetical protein TTHERM_00049220 [Tetrahymena thermophila SB210]
MTFIIKNCLGKLCLRHLLMKEDSYKSLCTACFQQKAAYYLCCRCIFCKECIQRWKDSYKTIENSADVICGFCNKQTDPKINSFQDMKQAQSFAFLFADPETLFERQIEIIKFQRKQSLKYIQYLQDQLNINKQELSLIYESFPEIKNEISVRRMSNTLNNEDDIRKISRSCVNFKQVNENIQNDSFQQNQLQNQVRESNKINQFQVNPQYNQQYNLQQNLPYQKDYQTNEPQQQQQYQQQKQLMINKQNNQINKNNLNTIGYQNKPIMQQRNEYVTPIQNNISNFNINNKISNLNNSGGLSYQDYMQKQQNLINYNQIVQGNSIQRKDSQQRNTFNQITQQYQFQKEIEDSSNPYINHQQGKQNDFTQVRNKMQPSKENMNLVLNQAYTSYNQNQKPQLSYQQKYIDQYNPKLSK